MLRFEIYIKDYDEDTMNQFIKIAKNTVEKVKELDTFYSTILSEERVLKLDI